MLAHQRHRVGVLMRILLVLALSASCATASPARRFAATSSAVITIKKDDSSFFGASASDNDWGATLPPQKSRDRAFYPLVYTTPSLSDPFGCSSPEALANKTNKSNIAFQLPTKPFVLLVDRGGCAYSLKALYAKQLGAAALLVTDTQQQAYNRTLAADATPESKALEFSCANGHAEIEAREAHKMTDFTAPRWDERVNALRCASSPSCDSSMCIPSSASGRQVCCLWDVADPMGFSATSNGVNITKDDVADLPVVKLLIEDGIALKSLLTNFTAAKEELLVTLYDRKAPMADPSQFIIWLLAIITVMIGGYKGATAERERALRKQSLLAEREANAAGADHTSDSMMNESMMTGTTAPLAREESQNEADALEDETLDLNMYHALAFVVFATAFLLVLFYWNIVLVVVIFFAIGSVSCSYYILWQPLFERMAVLRKEPFAKNPPTSSFLQSLEIQTWRIADMLAFVWSLGVSVLWFVCRNRQYAWMLQDVFGVCLCILFLRTIRLPNLKVATFMLVLVFLYDIFMVFLSGYIFSKSLMISAATGGSQGEPTVGSDYCLRYPTDTAHKCMKESMPILLRFPKVIDWRAGQSMLGLGDIVLPGLLVVFCARFDYATRGQLLGRVKGPHLARLKASHHDLTNDLPDLPESEVGSVPSQRQRPQNHQPHLAELSMPAASRRGLFGIMMWGYAVGLMLANIGVMVMKEGQPALMYLVPCTLGVLYIVAWRRGILKKLWDGPEEFRAHGTETVTTERSMTMRERGFTVDHVIQEHDDDGSSILEISNNNDTPVSTYARPEGTPKHR